MSDNGISEAWRNLILFCQEKAPHCDIAFKVVEGQPTELISLKPRIRFDKRGSVPNLFGLKEK